MWALNYIWVITCLFKHVLSQFLNISFRQKTHLNYYLDLSLHSLIRHRLAVLSKRRKNRGIFKFQSNSRLERALWFSLNLTYKIPSMKLNFIPRQHLSKFAIINDVASQFTITDICNERLQFRKSVATMPFVWPYHDLKLYSRQIIVCMSLWEVGWSINVINLRHRTNCYCVCFPFTSCNKIYWELGSLYLGLFYFDINNCSSDFRFPIIILFSLPVKISLHHNSWKFKV